MTNEQALEIIKQPGRIGCNLIKANDEESNKYNHESIEALNMVRKALEIVIDFEKAQIITDGRLNGRTYAYKCGLEDGKRKALEESTRKVGKWLSKVYQNKNCSVCNYYIPEEDAEEFKYCPNCGAEMRGYEK